MSQVLLTTSDLIAKMKNGEAAECVEGPFQGKRVRKSIYGIHDEVSSAFLGLSKTTLEAKWAIEKL